MRPYRLPFCALGESSGELVGVVTEDAIRRLPADAWSLTSARRIAVPLGEVVTCQSSEPLAPVAGRLAGSMVPGALVFDGTRLVGVITADDLRYAALRGQARTNASWPSGRGPVVEHPGKP
jgi:CBS domain-containing protein